LNKTSVVVEVSSI